MIESGKKAEDRRIVSLHDPSSGLTVYVTIARGFEDNEQVINCAYRLLAAVLACKLKKLHNL